MSLPEAISEESSPLPVIPVLAYANPIGAQPANGRLTIESNEHGIVITDPLSADTSPTLLRWVGGIMFWLGIAAVAANIFWIFTQTVDDYGRLILASVASLLGLAILVGSRKAKQRPRIIWLVNGRLFTTGCPNLGLLSGRIPKSFKASSNLLSYRICVQYRFGLKCELLPALSRDEAIWAVGRLNLAAKLIEDKASINNARSSG